MLDVCQVEAFLIHSAFMDHFGWHISLSMACDIGPLYHCPFSGQAAKIAGWNAKDGGSPHGLIVQFR